MTTRELTGVNELHTLLGEGACFSGKLSFEGRVRIDGRFDGEVDGQGTLILGERAEVQATVRVATLIMLGGTLRGAVNASRAVELHAPAEVHGDITTPSLVIDRGVVFEGQSRPPRDAPARPDDDPQPGGAPARTPSEEAPKG